MGGCISALLAASVLQQSVVSADVEDTGDTTKSVQHAPAVHTRPNVQQKCSFCGQQRKGHTCLFVEGTIKWRDLCATVCQGGSRNGCARCRSSVTKRARGKEDAAGGAGGGVSISGGGSAHTVRQLLQPPRKRPCKVFWSANKRVHHLSRHVSKPSFLIGSKSWVQM